MEVKSFLLDVSPSIGAVSAEYIIPHQPKYVMTLAHGAGAGMNHPFMVTLANALAEFGMATLRFNFAFMENKKGRPDTPVVAHQIIEKAMSHTHETFPEIPLFVSGKSFGGRMTSQFLSSHPADSIKGMIFYGFPLHPQGKPSTDRAEHLKNVNVPMLFLQGTKDDLATWDLIESVCGSLPTSTLVSIEGANHAFKAGKQDIMQVLVNETHDWILHLMKPS